MKIKNNLMLGLLTIGQLTAFSDYVDKQWQKEFLKYQKSLNAQNNQNMATPKNFAGVWLELGGGYESNKLKLDYKREDISEHCNYQNGSVIARAIFADVNQNNLYSAVVVGAIVNPKNVEKKIIFEEWRNKCLFQFGIELGYELGPVLLFSSVLGTATSDSLAGAFGGGIGIAFKNFQLRAQAAFIKSNRQHHEDISFKENRIATFITIAFKN
jgi:hypothetical protein